MTISWSLFPPRVAPDPQKETRFDTTRPPPPPNRSRNEDYSPERPVPILRSVPWRAQKRNRTAAGVLQRGDELERVAVRSEPPKKVRIRRRSRLNAVAVLKRASLRCSFQRAAKLGHWRYASFLLLASAH